MFTGKNAIVTGGSRGIGRAIALALARHHARVAVFYAGNETAAKETAAFAAEAGGEIRTARCDVSDAASVKQACGALQEEWGGIDFLINCAGITRDGLMMRMKDEDFDAVLSTNLRGAVLMTRACAGTMVKRRFGRIINIASTSGLYGTPKLATYCMAKWGVLGLTKTLAKEVGSKGIIVNALCPTKVKTPMCETQSYVEFINELTGKNFKDYKEMYAGVPFLDVEDISDMVYWLGTSRAAGKFNGRDVALDLGTLQC